MLVLRDWMWVGLKLSIDMGYARWNSPIPIRRAR